MAATTSAQHDRSPLSGPCPELAYVPLDKIEVGPQPRENAAESAIDELVPSIKQYDVLQPILLRRLSSGRYQLVAGERRFLAAKAAGKTTIPASIRYLTDGQAAELALVENVCRRDLNPIEKARAIKGLAGTNLALTVKDVARLCGKSGVWAYNLTRLLKLPAAWQSLVAGGEVPESCARLLLTYLDDPAGETILEAVRLDRVQDPAGYITRSAFERTAAAVAGRVRDAAKRPQLRRADPAPASRPVVSPGRSQVNDPAAPAKPELAVDPAMPAKSPNKGGAWLAAKVCNWIQQLDTREQLDQVRQALDERQAELSPTTKPIRRPRRRAG